MHAGLCRRTDPSTGTAGCHRHCHRGCHLRRVQRQGCRRRSSYRSIVAGHPQARKQAPERQLDEAALGSGAKPEPFSHVARPGALPRQTDPPLRHP
eukprot:349632-Chlamydomonas_euryale.AAC.63